MTNVGNELTDFHISHCEWVERTACIVLLFTGTHGSCGRLDPCS